jgi:hypothetical protein
MFHPNKEKLSNKIIQAQEILQNSGYLNNRYKQILNYEELIENLKKISTYDDDMVQVFQKILKTNMKIEYRFPILSTLNNMKLNK